MAAGLLVKQSTPWQGLKQSEVMVAENVSKRQEVVLDSASQRVFRMRKGILTASRLINARLANNIDDKGRLVSWVPLMVTLTYKQGVNWSPDHVTNYLRTVRKWGIRRGFSFPYCWVMELQKNGTPHYHCIIWIPRKLKLPKSDIQGWWPHGSTNTVRANNPYGYLSKYASKAQGPKSTEGGYCHQFPRGARIHGIGGLTDKEAAIIAWWKLPKALRLGSEGSHIWRRASGGGWRCIEGDALGQFYDSGWGLSSINTEKKRVRLCEKPLVHHDRCINSLVDHDKEARYEKVSILRQNWCLPLEKYRVSWGSDGVAVESLILDALPSQSKAIPVNHLGKYQHLPLPF